jgi:ADP-heptose:LPS heptosyltransferase
MFPETSKVREILAIRLARLGDVILLLPALGRLKRACPRSRLTLLTGAPCRTLAQLCPDIDDVMAVDRVGMRDGSSVRAVIDMAGLVRTIRRRRFDLVVDFHSLRETNFLARLSGAPWRIAMQRSDRAYVPGCFNLPPLVEDKDLHVGEMFVRVSDHVVQQVEGCPPPGESVAGRGIAVSPKLLEAVRNRYRGDVRRPLLVAYVGAPVPQRRWPAERFAEVARHVADHWDADVAVLTGSGAGEAAIGDRVAELAGVPANVRHLAGLDVPEMAALVHDAKLLVSNDTGPMHLGPALGVPTLALFSVGFPEHFRPTGAGDRVLRAQPISDIGVRDVVSAIEEMWGNEKKA